MAAMLIEPTTASKENKHLPPRSGSALEFFQNKMSRENEGTERSIEGVGFDEDI